MDFEETIIYLQEFLKTKKISHNNFRNDVDINTSDKIITFTPSIKKGVFNYDFYPERDCEIVDNFSICCKEPIEVSYICGGNYYSPNEFQEFVYQCSPYHEFKIRITFSPPFSFEETPTITIQYRTYWFNNVEDRRELIKSTLITKYLTYKSGMTYKN